MSETVSKELGYLAQAIVNVKMANEDLYKTRVIRYLAVVLENAGYGKEKRSYDRTAIVIRCTEKARAIFDSFAIIGYITYEPCKPLIINAGFLSRLIYSLMEPEQSKSPKWCDEVQRPIKALIYEVTYG